MAVRRKGRFAAGKKSYHIVEGEILHIGAHPHGYSNLQHIVLGLTNSQAAEYMELGWNVRMSNKETYFLGRRQEEIILYIVLDIPKHFEVDKISSWRTSAYIQDTQQAVVEFSSQEVIFEYYEPGEPNKVSFRLILDEIYTVDDEEDDQVQEGSLLDRVRKGEHRGVIEIPEWEYRELITRDIAGAETVGDIRKIQNRQRGFDTRNNPVKTNWIVGETIRIEGDIYRIGAISDFRESWRIRLDRKFEPSLFITVPK